MLCARNTAEDEKDVNFLPTSMVLCSTFGYLPPSDGRQGINRGWMSVAIFLESGTRVPWVFHTCPPMISSDLVGMVEYDGASGDACVVNTTSSAVVTADASAAAATSTSSSNKMTKAPPTVFVDIYNYLGSLVAQLPPPVAPEMSFWWSTDSAMAFALLVGLRRRTFTTEVAPVWKMATPKSSSNVNTAKKSPACAFLEEMILGPVGFNAWYRENKEERREEASLIRRTLLKPLHKPTPGSLVAAGLVVSLLVLWGGPPNKSAVDYLEGILCPLLRKGRADFREHITPILCLHPHRISLQPWLSAAVERAARTCPAERVRVQRVQVMEALLLRHPKVHGWYGRLGEMRPCANGKYVRGTSVEAILRPHLHRSVFDLLRVALVASSHDHVRQNMLVRKLYTDFLLPLFGDAPKTKAHSSHHIRYEIVRILLQSGVFPVDVIGIVTHTLRDTSAVLDVKMQVRDYLRPKRTQFFQNDKHSHFIFDLRVVDFTPNSLHDIGRCFTEWQNVDMGIDCSNNFESSHFSKKNNSSEALMVDDENLTGNLCPWLQSFADNIGQLPPVDVVSPEEESSQLFMRGLRSARNKWKKKQDTTSAEPHDKTMTKRARLNQNCPEVNKIDLFDKTERYSLPKLQRVIEELRTAEATEPEARAKKKLKWRLDYLEKIVKQGEIDPNTPSGEVILLQKTYYKKTGLGRAYCTGPSFQGCPSELRGRIIVGGYSDVDLCNSHPRLLLDIARRHNIDAPRLQEYVENRAELLEDMSLYYGNCGRGEVKNCVLRLINRGNIEGWVQNLYKGFTGLLVDVVRKRRQKSGDHPVLRDLKQEIQGSIMEAMIRVYPQADRVLQQALAENTSKKYTRWSLFSWCLHNVERECLQCIEAFLIVRAPKATVDAYVHDAVWVRTGTGNPLGDTVLRDCEKHVHKRLGWSVALDETYYGS